MENMTEIFAKLTETLRLTRDYSNIVSITPMTVEGTEYIKEVARIKYSNGHTKDIDIGCDSGIAAIYDISKHLAFN